MKMTHALSPALLALLAACSVLEPDQAPLTAPASSVPPPEEIVPDEAEAVQSGALGSTIATLGAAGTAGMWLETPLVTTRQAGKLYSPKTGQRIDVTLIPIDGPKSAGSRISLQAMQGLGLPLTSLAEIEVSA